MMILLILLVVVICGVMAMLALAGPLLEDLFEWFRRPGPRHPKPVPRPRDERVARPSLHR